MKRSSDQAGRVDMAKFRMAVLRAKLRSMGLFCRKGIDAETLAAVVEAAELIRRECGEYGLEQLTSCGSDGCTQACTGYTGDVMDAALNGDESIKQPSFAPDTATKRKGE